MIDPQELPAYIGKAIPELSQTIEQQDCKNVYDIVKEMITYTSIQVVHHNTAAAKKCLHLAEQLYKHGNAAIKNAIENVFVYSFSHSFFHDTGHNEEVMKIVPPSLYNLYRKQVLNSHL